MLQNNSIWISYTPEYLSLLELNKFLDGVVNDDVF